MKDQYVKHLAGAAATLFVGVGFAFKFLLDAKEHPELSLVLLATVALVVGTLSLSTAFGQSAFIGQAFQDAYKMRNLGGRVGSFVGLLGLPPN